MASIRKSGFTHDEDVLLCSTYLELTQDLTTEPDETRERKWGRVATVYNATEQLNVEHRSWRSLESRYHKIDMAVRKLKECLEQIEQKIPSGASDLDIMYRAKQLMWTDPNFKSGFKFDHVWSLLKDVGKSSDNGRTARQMLRTQNSETENPTQQSTGLSDFSSELNDLNENNSTSRSSEIPMRVKKAKLEKKKETRSKESKLKMVDNVKLCELLAESNAIRKRQLKTREDKVMARDVNKIEDPVVRDYFRRRQHEIAECKFEEDAQKSQLPSLSTMNDYNYLNNFLNNFHGTSDDDYVTDY
ncbi:uncharacterized protein [Euphorbia lathyris]|uniref:uncharacterized protein n=1 Tax=Euphorbia lathyris TaxID=212925 RepID=UPI00331418F1